MPKNIQEECLRWVLPTEEKEHSLREASSAVAGSITKEHRQKAKEKLDDWFGDLDES